MGTNNGVQTYVINVGIFDSKSSCSLDIADFISPLVC